MIQRADSGRLREGRPRGGPLVFCLALAGITACGGGSGERPTPRADALVARPLQTYRQLGLLAGPPEFPAVVDVATVAGPADSAYVLLSMSLPNSALRFHRDPVGFQASYNVAVEFRQDAQVKRRIARREVVNVPSFAETGRTDESIVFQHAVLLAAGQYEVGLHAAAEGSRRGFEAVDTIVVPAYGPGGSPMAGPVVVYEGNGRTSKEALPDVILNPRHTVAYGGADPRLYIEWYGAGELVPLSVRVFDEREDSISAFQAAVPAGEAEVRHAFVDLPVGDLPLGRIWVEIAAAGRARARTPLVISISDQWMVANFDDVLQFLRYIATNRELEELREGTPQERRERWELFWARRDPIPATPSNEYRDEFFQRVRYATEHLGEPGGLSGWRTHRGEVYIVLGPPTFQQEWYVGRADLGQPNAIEWIYDGLPGGRLALLFFDRTGFGRFELTPSSEAAFRSIADRLKARSDRDIRDPRGRARVAAHERRSG